MDKAIFDRVKTAVHNPLDYKEYDATETVDSINCYAHAIGATAVHRKLRVGDLCGKKAITQMYLSDDEIETLFLQDMAELELECQKRYFEESRTWNGRKQVLDKLSNTMISQNTVIVLLFVLHNGDGSIRDFHFWRYDGEKGFTEKRPRQRLSRIEDPAYSWPASELNHFVGMYLIKKKR